MSDIESIKKLRADTGAGLADVKEALEISKGDIESAKAYLTKKGIAKAEKRSEREANQGVVGSYIHNTNKIGVLVEVNCETDFVAKNEDFIAFAKEVALQICATNPLYLSESEIPANIREEFVKEVASDPKFESKPEEVRQNIIDAKVKKYATENCLMSQEYFKDSTQTIEQMMKTLSAKVGEAVKIRKFVRMEIGN